MLDIKFIRENPDKVKEACRKKKINFDVDNLLKLDAQRRELIVAIENKSAMKNQATKRIQEAKTKEERELVIAQMRELDRNSDNEEDQFKKINEEFERLMLLVPNIPDESVPEGGSDADNLEIKKWGKINEFNFPIKDHIQLAKDLDLIDFERGAKVVGFRGYFLKREAVLICMAIWQYAMETLMKRGFTPIQAPSLVKEEAMTGT
ncbi:MAG: serine--tRNA ligase, partial [Minisyncoccales bacterium]